MLGVHSEGEKEHYITLYQTSQSSPLAFQDSYNSFGAEFSFDELMQRQSKQSWHIEPTELGLSHDCLIKLDYPITQSHNKQLLHHKLNLPCPRIGTNHDLQHCTNILINCAKILTQLMAMCVSAIRIHTHKYKYRNK